MLRCAPISSLLEIGTQVRKSGLINPTCGVRLSKHCAGRMLRDALLRNAPQHERERYALPYAYAHCGERKLAIALLQSVHRRERKARTRHAERVAERDRPAM